MKQKDMQATVTANYKTTEQTLGSEEKGSENKNLVLLFWRIMIFKNFKQARWQPVQKRGLKWRFIALKGDIASDYARA